MPSGKMFISTCCLYRCPTNRKAAELVPSGTMFSSFTLYLEVCLLYTYNMRFIYDRERWKRREEKMREDYGWYNTTRRKEKEERYNNRLDNP
jgi:hypothetical protein